MKASRSENVADLVLAVVLLTIAVVTLREFAGLPAPRYEPLGVGFLPRALSFFFLGTSMILLIRVSARVYRLATRPSRYDFKDADSVLTQRVSPHVKRPMLGAVTVASLTVYVALLRILGFRIASIVFVIAMGSIYSRFEPGIQRKRVIFMTVVLSLLLSQALFSVFSILLRVRVP